MGRYLMLDIGAGTLDILCHDTDHDLHYKAVVRSPVRVLADEIRQTRGNLVVTGCEMGGGPVSQALIDRAKTFDVVMSEQSAATIHHDVQRVIAHGIRVVAAAEADALKNDSRFHHIRTGDLQLNRLRRLVQGFGVPFEFDAVAVCAQDHGVAPPGVSHLDFRHRMFTAALDRNPAPQALLYRFDQVPAEMNRLSAIANDAKALPTDRVYVMDSGMAAILGASMDVLAAEKKRILVL
ncbi:MAG: pyruvate formate-lyase activating enzyme, partial [Desulfosarcina sp.]|nr:pyruvate formate-lyase activating enzyme [Desulfosarcina sp.]